MQTLTGSSGDTTGLAALNYSPNITPEMVILAALTLVVGYIVAKVIVRLTERMLKKQGHLTEVAAGLLGRIIAILLYIIIIILIAVSFLGVNGNSTGNLRSLPGTSNRHQIPEKQIYQVPGIGTPHLFLPAYATADRSVSNPQYYNLSIMYEFV